MKKHNSDEDNWLLVVFLFITKFFFSIFKIDFFPKYQINLSKLFWFWNFRWWSTLWAEKLFLKVVHIGFKYPEKVFFVSLKKQQIVDYLRRYWLFSNFLSLFVLISWKFGEHPSILHEKKLFEFGVRIWCFAAYVTNKKYSNHSKKFFWYEKVSNYHFSVNEKFF